MHNRKARVGVEVKTHSLLTLALAGGERLVSRPDHCSHGTHSVTS
jgi:hypothetical protein